MSVNGMREWLEQSGFGEGFASEEFLELRAELGSRLDKGEDPRALADETCEKGSECEFECVTLAVVLVEDRNVAILDVPRCLKEAHDAVGRYLRHTSEGARALTPAFAGAEG